MFKSILMICTGNICRSPMAEGLLRTRIKRAGTQVMSAGVGAMVNWPADPLAIEVMRDYGVDISGHRAQQVTVPMLSAHELVLTLDQSHSDWLNRSYPQFRGRVHKLLKWEGNRDVADPYQLPKSAFETAFDDIEIGVESWLQRLK